MPFNFPGAPSVEGLTFVNVQPALFADHRTGQRKVFPVYYFKEDATGELVLITEERYEIILDKLIWMGAFRTEVGRA